MMEDTGAGVPPAPSTSGVSGPRNLADLLPEVYGELRRLAARQLRRERAGHTLQPTALVHEAFLRLSRQSRTGVAGRSHLIALAAGQMRRVLVDHARRRLALKRGQVTRRITLTDDIVGLGRSPLDVLAFERVLERLESIDPTAAHVVLCRFYGGMTEGEIAETMGISERWVRHHWAHARAWLRRELDRDG